MSADNARQQGVALHYFRKLRRVTRGQIFEKTGVPTAMLERAEHGIESLDANDLALVLVALGFDLIDLQLLITFGEQLTRKEESVWGT